MEPRAAGPVQEDSQQEALALLEWPRLCSHLASFASTTAGHGFCRHTPLPESIGESRRLLAETAELQGLDGLLEGGLSFRGVSDLTDTLRRCDKGGSASGEALLALARTLAAARRLRRQIDDPALRPVTTALLEGVRTLPELEQRLNHCLEEGGRVADRASPALTNLRRQLAVLRDQLRDRLGELQRRHAGLLQDRVISSRNGRPVLAVKAAAASALPGLVHDSSASGSTLFIEPEQVIGLGNRLRAKEGEERDAIEAVLRDLSGEVAGHVDHLMVLQGVLVQLDAALARARYGQHLGAILPQLEEGGDSCFDLVGLRHPLLVWQHGRGQGNAVVPVDLQVSAELRVVAITGPNTGGKTVTLKSLGLASLMARAGLFVPCTGRARLPWCRQVLADIGDEQSLEQNLSTFSGHVRRIARILAALAANPQAGQESLVLLDEVGAGTDPAEGTALAMALLSQLAERARLTVATTHFGELKALKYEDPRFENASVSFDDTTLSPTFRLRWGIPGRSHALAIAERLELDPLVLERARQLLARRRQGDMNAVISGLEAQRQRQQAAAEAAAELLARSELLHGELQQRWERLCSEGQEQRERRRAELQRSIAEGQQEVRRIIHSLRQAGADAETARQAGQRLKHLARDHAAVPERREQRGWQPAVGDRIRLLSLGRAAEVEAISGDGRQLQVRCGVLRLSVGPEAIESLQGEKPATPQPASVAVRCRQVLGSQGPQLRTTVNTIDVRGMRVHEAEAVVEDHLRSAAGPIWVVHGIGSGRLKRGLRHWLTSVPYVERVADAEQADGGAGCSVIWPKG